MLLDWIRLGKTQLELQYRFSDSHFKEKKQSKMEVRTNVVTLNIANGILIEKHQIVNCNALQELTPCNANETVEISKIKRDICPGSQCRNDTDAENEDCVSDTPSTEQTEGKDRMLMRQWLESNANNGELPGLKWLDKRSGLISIAWKHGSKFTWSPDDGEVFKSWAKYTGKYNLANDLPRKWKANFRCAINSLPDVVHVPEKSRKTGCNPCLVYRLLEQKPRKKGQKRISRSPNDKHSQGSFCLPDTTTGLDDVSMTSSDAKQTKDQRDVKRKTEDKDCLTSDPIDRQPSSVNAKNRVLIPTTVLDLCSDDEPMCDVNLDNVDRVCDSQMEQMDTADQPPLLTFEDSILLDVNLEDISLPEVEWLRNFEMPTIMDS